jgi:cysteinyl-tRNA synthetase, unknown class
MTFSTFVIILLLIAAALAIGYVLGRRPLGRTSAAPPEPTAQPGLQPPVLKPRAAPPPVNAGSPHHPGEAAPPPVVPIAIPETPRPEPVQRPVRTAAPPPAAAGASAARPPAQPQTAPAGLAGVKSWGYQLQHLDIGRAANAPFDLLVVDYAKDGSDDTALKPAEIERMKRTPDGSRRRVIAYMSIGEAESYRFYWDEAWKQQHPGWLLGENPEWRENYAVCFWDPGWQKLMCGGEGCYLDKIIDAGFDGVYLDKCDVYEDLKARHKREARTRPGIEKDMVDFVEQISRYAKSRAPGFAVIMQNAEALLSDARLRGAIDGVAKESLMFGLEGPEKKNPADEFDYARDQLDLLKADGKPVFVVEYIANPARVSEAAEMARQRGYILYVAPKDRELAKLNYQTLDA